MAAASFTTSARGFSDSAIGHLIDRASHYRGRERKFSGIVSWTNTPVRARADAEAAEMIRLVILTVLMLAAFNFWYWNRPAARNDPLPARVASSPEGPASSPEQAKPPSLPPSAATGAAETVAAMPATDVAAPSPTSLPPAPASPLSEQQASPPERPAPATATTSTPPKAVKAKTRSKNASRAVPQRPPPCPSDDEICLLLMRIGQAPSDVSVGTASAPASSGAMAPAVETPPATVVNAGIATAQSAEGNSSPGSGRAGGSVASGRGASSAASGGWLVAAAAVATAAAAAAAAAVAGGAGRAGAGGGAGGPDAWKRGARALRSRALAVLGHRL